MTLAEQILESMASTLPGSVEVRWGTAAHFDALTNFVGRGSRHACVRCTETTIVVVLTSAGSLTSKSVWDIADPAFDPVATAASMLEHLL